MAEGKGTSDPIATEERTGTSQAQNRDSTRDNSGNDRARNPDAYTLSLLVELYRETNLDIRWVWETFPHYVIDDLIEETLELRKDPAEKKKDEARKQAEIVKSDPSIQALFAQFENAKNNS